MKLSDLQVNSHSQQMHFKKKTEENRAGYKKVRKLKLYFVKLCCLNLLQNFHGHRMQSAQQGARGKPTGCTYSTCE